MNIMVYDVAAESGGAATVLEYFYNQHKKDKDNHYFYMLSTYQLEQTDNITVINVPEIKKGWKNRLLFDYFGVKKYLKEFEIDEIISLQNTIVPCFKRKQTVYVHNALPFAEYRFSLKENRLMWIYQNIIGKFIFSSIRKADHVIVQTQWMKDAVSKQIPGSHNKTEVCFPEVSLPEHCVFTRPERCIFFYPANSAPFKNHRLILQACLLLEKQNITDFTVVFTLRGDENDMIRDIRDIAEQHNIDIQWKGSQPREKVFEWYSKSVLVFPSYIETIGLPIYEAMSVGCPLLLSDCQYAREVAGRCRNAQYYSYNDAQLLSEYMQQQIAACQKLRPNTNREI